MGIRLTLPHIKPRFITCTVVDARSLANLGKFPMRCVVFQSCLWPRRWSWCNVKGVVGRAWLCSHGSVEIGPNVFAARCCLCVCPSRSWILSKRLTNKHIFISFHRRLATPFKFFHERHGDIPTGTPANGAVECRWGKQKSRFWANI